MTTGAQYFPISCCYGSNGSLERMEIYYHNHLSSRWWWRLRRNVMMIVHIITNYLSSPQSRAIRGEEMKVVVIPLSSRTTEQYSAKECFRDLWCVLCEHFSLYFSQSRIPRWFGSMHLHRVGYLWLNQIILHNHLFF